MKLSVLMPAYNEEQWIELIIERVIAQKVPGISEIEVVIVDDASTDGTRELIKKNEAKHPKIVRAVLKDVNQGKGAAIRTAIEKMSGDICIIQDADLEYNPADYPLILEPIIEGRADCVYGSRFMGSQSKRVLFFWHSVGNKFLTLLSNMFTNLNLSDMETCYKAFKSEVIKPVLIKSDRFGFEPEITAKLARMKCRIYEVGISYNGRTYEQGKKITWVDGIKAILTIVRYGFFDRRLYRDNF
jgi:glycosyltransferase involved in cell wall biosynthesis